ncbi:SMI1/KNR4 family protein [Bacteroides faecium]|uniref:SMI1/KNR4 family protein n=1 Tax=Bacteroides faecium TaxID=2715212 RepID=A0A6H0KMT6_9BACE|nr:SMI1/KNR4 family protein [Bacteroides faecium]QIU94519.1 SMI1/KNR4 family protein [Bacteroides faecium]
MEVIESKWYKKDGANTAFIEDVEKQLNTTLPKQYKSFLLWSNGGEGKLGDNYIYIWAIEDIIAYNHDYGIQKYLQKEYLAWMVILDIFFICLTIVYIGWIWEI